MNKDTRLSDKKTVMAFSVGDVVTTEYYEDDSDVERVITRIDPDEDTGSSLRIWATDGGICECCNKQRSRPINGVDGYWFLPVSVKS